MTAGTETAAQGVSPGPTPLGREGRALAPDLARGLMLLLIVLSNTGFHLYAARHGPTGWQPVDGGPLDRAAQFLMIVGLDLRVYPLFSFLLGYGMMQFFLRQTEGGVEPKRASRMLRKRSVWFVVFGFLHAALLMAGDILGAYGVMTFFLGWLFIRRSGKTQFIAACVFAVLLWALFALVVLTYISGEFVEHEIGTEAYASGVADPLEAAKLRLEMWVYVTLVGGLFGFASHASILLGFWAARRRVLESPGEHLRLLWSVAVIGLAIGWLGGLPTALGHFGLIEVADEALYMEGPFYMLQAVTGLFGGLGYAAAIAIVAHRLSKRDVSGPLVLMATAVGKRSLSSYLAFSLLFAPLLAAWGLGLGARLSSFTMVLFGVGVWLVVGAGCVVLERRGMRGPAEVVLRWLVYDRRARPGGATPQSML